MLLAHAFFFIGFYIYYQISASYLRTRNTSPVQNHDAFHTYQKNLTISTAAEIGIAAAAQYLFGTESGYKIFAQFAIAKLLTNLINFESQSIRSNFSKFFPSINFVPPRFSILPTTNSANLTERS